MLWTLRLYYFILTVCLLLSSSVRPGFPQQEEPSVLGIGYTETGTTNGNMQNEGRAVKRGNTVWAITDNYFTDSFTIEEENLDTQSSRVLFRSAALHVCSGGGLNYYNNTLYFYAENDDCSGCKLIGLSPDTGAAKVLYSRSGTLITLLVTDTKTILGAGGSETLVFDTAQLGTQEPAVLEGKFLGMLDGRLYLCRQNGQILFVDEKGGEHPVMQYADAGRVIPENGRLYILDNTYNMPDSPYGPWDYSAKLTVADAVTGETEQVIYAPVPCEDYFNISRDSVYFQQFVEDGRGPLWLYSFADGSFRVMQEKRWYFKGVTLLDGKPAETVSKLGIDYYYDPE